MAIVKKTPNAEDYVSNFLRQINKVCTDDFAADNIILNDSSGTIEKETYDVLIICALPEERNRVFDAFSVSEEDRRRSIQSFRSDYNFIYHKFSYAGFNIAMVTQNTMGMAAAASLTTRAILAMKPKLVAMTGICAGRKGKVKLGDILVADQVFDYTAGKKYVDKFAPRPLFFSTDDAIRNYVSTEILNNDQLSDDILQMWPGTRISHRISIHMKAIASGTAVIDDEQTMASAATVQDNLYGIDMEGYGVALACSALGTKWVVIKAVQDFADGKKEMDENGVRDFSAYASASLLKQMIRYIVD